jgi:alkanesulfonate monooxygenase SsuD/methylene tetrahydromethanopterin reductase-like flavin-dependent oxidoreductase (luciferase family)
MMRTGIFLSYADGGYSNFAEAADEVVELEKVGVDIALVAEAYSYDAISQLGFLAAKTSRIELGSGVVPIYVRTPSLLAMTAAGLDYVSNGRFRLGIGTSGPQVMEGFHGVPFDAPLGRTRGGRHLPAGVAPRAGAIRREVLPDSVARRPGHWPG